MEYKISINETELENKKFEELEINRNKNDWIYCRIKNNIFEGFGRYQILMNLFNFS